MGRALPIPAGHEGPSPSGSPAPRWRPSVPSVPPAVQPLPPASLGFLPEETREEAPRSRRQGCGGEGEAGNATARAIFGPCCQPSSRNGRPGARCSHAWPGARLNISPAVISLPCATLHCSQSCFSQRPPPTHTRRPLPPPAQTPVSRPTALPTPGRGREAGSPHGPRGHGLPHAGLRAAGCSPTSPSPQELCVSRCTGNTFFLPKAGGAGSVRPPHHAGLNSIAPSTAAPIALLPIIANPRKGLRGLAQHSRPHPFASAHEKRRLRRRTTAEAWQHHPVLPKQGESRGCSRYLGEEMRH